MAHNFVAYFNPVTGVYAFSECTLCSAHAGTDQGNAPCLRAVPQPATEFVRNDLQVAWNAIVNHDVIKDSETNIWTLHDGVYWDGGIVQLLNRSCYDEIITELDNKSECS